MAEELDGKAVVEAYVDNVLNTRFEDIEPAIVENTKQRVFDVIGCALGGAAAPGNRQFIGLIKGWGGKKEATILAYGLKAPAQDAAWANAILCRSFDWEPLVAIVEGKRYPGHVSGTTVSTAITMAETRGVSGKELITALVAGDDIAERIYAAGGAPFKQGQAGGQKNEPTFDAWGTMPSFGAVAIAGRLLGLDRNQLKNAFGIVINMISGAGGGLGAGATTFKLSQGTSARSGVVAAELAKAGWTGIPDPFFGKSGYFTNFTTGCDNPGVLTRELGKKYYVEVVFKPYPGGRPTHTTIDVALALSKNHNFSVDDIEKVVVRLSPPMRYAHYMKPYKVGDYPTGDALFSYKFSTATALVKKQVTAANFVPDAIKDPAVQSLISKIELASDLDKDNGIETVVTLKDGTSFKEYLRDATGELPAPLSWDALKKKFLTQVEFSKMINPASAEKIFALSQKLETLDNINQIIKLAIR